MALSNQRHMVCLPATHTVPVLSFLTYVSLLSLFSLFVFFLPQKRRIMVAEPDADDGITHTTRRRRLRRHGGAATVHATGRGPARVSPPSTMEGRVPILPVGQRRLHRTLQAASTTAAAKREIILTHGDELGARAGRRLDAIVKPEDGHWCGRPAGPQATDRESSKR